MSVNIEDRDDVLIFTPEEDFTFFFLQEFKEKLYSFINEGRHKFIFNFENVGWVDSMGISVMILAGKSSAEHHFKTYIVNANDKVVYSISLLKINEYIEILKNIDAAMNNLK